jgi:hypothetical protein
MASEARAVGGETTCSAEPALLLVVPGGAGCSVPQPVTVAAVDAVSSHHAIRLLLTAAHRTPRVDGGAVETPLPQPNTPRRTSPGCLADKASLYTALRRRNVAAADFHLGTLSRSFLLDAVTSLGLRPVLKPATGAGSRGVYRYRDDLTVDDNLSLYQQLLRLGHIDTQTQIIAAQYLGEGDAALEISVDTLVCAGQVSNVTVHEKLTATAVHPFVDNIMISPPTNQTIVDELSQLPHILADIVTTLNPPRRSISSSASTNGAGTFSTSESGPVLDLSRTRPARAPAWTLGWRTSPRVSAAPSAPTPSPAPQVRTPRPA